MQDGILHIKYSEILLLLKTKFGWNHYNQNELTQCGKDLVHNTLSAQLEVSYEQKKMSFIQRVVFKIFFKDCIIFKKHGL